MSKTMLLGLRCAFADQLYVPGIFPGADGNAVPAHGLTLIVDPNDTANVDTIDEAIRVMAEAKWKDKAAKILETCMKDRKKSAWQKVEYTNDEGTPYDGFADMFYLRARNEDAPLILDHMAEEVTRGKTGAPYGGCYVNAQVELFAQDNSFGKAIRCKLLGVQFIRDGDAFASGSKADKSAFKPTLAVSQDDEGDDDLA